MKKSIANVFVVALVAATSFQTVAAQQQVANNRRERILQVLDQSRPNAYVPAAFFLHFASTVHPIRTLRHSMPMPTIPPASSMYR